jgi:hypothetical protein
LHVASSDISKTLLESDDSRSMLVKVVVDYAEEKNWNKTDEEVEEVKNDIMAHNCDVQLSMAQTLPII